MFVLYVFFNKDEREKPGQSGQRSRDRLQRENKKSCVVSEDKRNEDKDTSTGEVENTRK
jgi:hypothetical protein